MQDVLQRCFWRLCDGWSIFVTCNSILDLSCDFGFFLQGFFVTAVLTRVFYFILFYFILFPFSLFIYLSIIICSPLSFLFRKCAYYSCEFRVLNPIKSLTIPIIWISWKRLGLHVLPKRATIWNSKGQWWWPHDQVLRFNWCFPLFFVGNNNDFCASQRNYYFKTGYLLHCATTFKPTLSSYMPRCSSMSSQWRQPRKQEESSIITTAPPNRRSNYLCVCFFLGRFFHFSHA